MRSGDATLCCQPPGSGCASWQSARPEAAHARARRLALECLSTQAKDGIIQTPLIPDDEIELSAIRAQGSGGQNVNKVSSAIHLRFDIQASSLPAHLKERLLALRDQRISKDGVIIIKAQAFRSQEKNKEEAIRRLHEMLASVTVLPPTRRATKPTRSAKRKRLEQKTSRGQIKLTRAKVTD